MKYFRNILIIGVLGFNFLFTVAFGYYDNNLVKFDEIKYSQINQNISGLDLNMSSGTEIITHLSQDSGLKVLFQADAGVYEGYSIKEHTLMVFNIFTKQFPLYQAYYNFQVLPDVRLLQTLKLALALHDIGKPYAIMTGDKSQQHEFTMPILEKIFRHLKFSTNEIKLAKALVDNDIIGELLQDVIGVAQAKNELTVLAESTGMSLANYASLQFLFYAADAGSYPSLYKRVFKLTNNGLLTPNADKYPKFQQLCDSIFKD